jgi:alpha-aminoadipate carrier protein LysW
MSEGRGVMRESAVSSSCPECGGAVSPAVPSMVGEIVQCPDCGVELEVKSTDPLELAVAPLEEEDWGE